MTQPVYNIDVVVGTRPNFVKAAPLVKAIDEADGLKARLVHTGQHDHPALSDIFFQTLSMRAPDIHLGTAGGSQAVQTGKVMAAYETALAVPGMRPDAVIVIGDVNSTLGAAISAKKTLLPLLHLEAGLRAQDRDLPEEINRLAVDAIADRFWTPSADATENLLSEGKARTSICEVGNFVIDSLTRIYQPSAETPLGLQRENYIVVTLHRPSNIDNLDRLQNIMVHLEGLAQNTPVIFPTHPRLKLSKAETFAPSVRFVPPMDYAKFLSLQSGAALVITDSGGVQEETSQFGVPCLTLRKTTERPVTVEEGTNSLVSLDALTSRVEDCLNMQRPKPAKITGWDGQAAIRGVQDLLRWLPTL